MLRSGPRAPGHANLVFTHSFADTEQADAAFGWNLLGAACGGALEHLALAYGYQQLILVAAALYGLATLFGTRVRVLRIARGSRAGAALRLAEVRA